MPKKTVIACVKTICLMAVILCVSSQCRAQMATAELSGNVLDASGAAVPGATVTAINVDTTITHTTVSQKSGDYVLTDLAPGNYTLTVEAAGFRKLEQTGVDLQVNQQARVDLTLQVGQTAQTVNVTGHPPMLESESSSVGTVINQQLVNELPLNGRNFVQLATLSPGVNGVGESTTGTIMAGDARMTGGPVPKSSPMETAKVTITSSSTASTTTSASPSPSPCGRRSKRA